MPSMSKELLSELSLSAMVSFLHWMVSLDLILCLWLVRGKVGWQSYLSWLKPGMKAKSRRRGFVTGLHALISHLNE